MFVEGSLGEDAGVSDLEAESAAGFQRAGKTSRRYPLAGLARPSTRSKHAAG